MTDPEWAYLYQEFLGTLLDSERPPTEREKQMALVWADEQFRRLKEYERTQDKLFLNMGDATGNPTQG